MSFHLLICCIDLIYKNVLAENPDLINTKFVGIPPKWGKQDFDTRIIKDYCIIEPLCNMTNASPHDAKNIKDTFKRIIIKFLETNVSFIAIKYFIYILISLFSFLKRLCMVMRTI